MSADNFHFVALSGNVYLNLSASQWWATQPLTEKHLIDAGISPREDLTEEDLFGDLYDCTEYGVWYEPPQDKQVNPFWAKLNEYLAVPEMREGQAYVNAMPEELYEKVKLHFGDIWETRRLPDYVRNFVAVEIEIADLREKD